MFALVTFLWERHPCRDRLTPSALRPCYTHLPSSCWLLLAVYCRQSSRRRHKLQQIPLLCNVNFGRRATRLFAAATWPARIAPEFSRRLCGNRSGCLSGNGGRRSSRRSSDRSRESLSDQCYFGGGGDAYPTILEAIWFACNLSHPAGSLDRT